MVKCSLALLEPLLSEGSLSHFTAPHNSYVITLFADATIIPFTLSADATTSSWTPIKITYIASVWKAVLFMLLCWVFVLLPCGLTGRRLWWSLSPWIHTNYNVGLKRTLSKYNYIDIAECQKLHYISLHISYLLKILQNLNLHLTLQHHTIP